MADYLDNQRLHAVFVAWRASEQFPHEIPEEIVTALQALVDGLSHHGSFAGYSYVADMKQEALVNCCQWGARSFDPARFKNPHAYFTMICWRSFGGTIKREKRQRTPDALHFSDCVEEMTAAPAPDESPEASAYGVFGALSASQLTTVLKVSRGGHKSRSPHVRAVCSALGVDDRTELLALLRQHGAAVTEPFERRPAPSMRALGRELRRRAGDTGRRPAANPQC